MEQKSLRNISYNDKYKLTNTDKSIEVDICDCLNDLKIHLSESIIEKSSNWLIEEQQWIKNEKGDLGTSDFYTYLRGDIIASVDNGTLRFGTEIRYPHPCVVLYDDVDWVIVAPITGASYDKAKRKYVFHAPFEVYTDKTKKTPKDKSEFIFRKESVIQVDQIFRASKHRIKNKKRYKLRVDLLNQIDNVILEYYIPIKHKLLKDIKSMLVDNLKILEEKNSEINTLKYDLKIEKEKNDALKKNINDNNNDSEIAV